MKPLHIQITKGDSLKPNRLFACLADDDGVVENVASDDGLDLIARVAAAIVKARPEIAAAQWDATRYLDEVAQQ